MKWIRPGVLGAYTLSMKPLLSWSQTILLYVVGDLVLAKDGEPMNGFCWNKLAVVNGSVSTGILHSMNHQEGE